MYRRGASIEGCSLHSLLYLGGTAYLLVLPAVIGGFRVQQCVKEKHKGHDAVSVVDERATQQKKLQESSLKSVQKLKDTEKELRYVVRYIKHSTEAAVEESERVFSKLIRSIEKQSSEVKEVMRVQERAAVSQAEELLEKIQRDVTELRRTGAELEKISGTENHIHFLQKCKSLHFPTKTVEMPSTDALQYLMYKTMRGALADLKDSLDETLEREFNRISDKVISLKETSNQSTSEKPKVISLKETSDQSTSEKTKVKDTEVPYNSEPKTRADFLQYYNDITLDLNTANPYLSFSDGQREQQHFGAAGNKLIEGSIIHILDLQRKTFS
ncbi:hypothetical protein EPR50_G00126850 [Perca flavescens]|uniref:TRIM8/14/16/25/29/45/65 coiled-coil region domain-containing protein n=1 Tax=Perca flavescens TaxID=8167 RepID=A0A484CQK5_PERFV|nr:hypothetical protein EPR50_G00126850 [Perca flavescens]